MTQLLGIDIGGSGIKGALVDLLEGGLAEERTRIETPVPATVESVIDVVAKVAEAFPHIDGPMGCTFPGIVKEGVIGSAANVDPGWVGVDADTLLSERCERPVSVVNDADAAGLAEAAFGAGRRAGVVLLLTFGTGIGSALLVDGVLAPNTELGHLEMDGRIAEDIASSRVRKERGLTLEAWAPLVNRYLAHVERLFSPDRIVLGGGVSRRFDQFGHLLSTNAELVPAALRNDAGIVGAAMWASLQAGLANSR